MNAANITDYKTKDFAELLGASVKMLRRWNKKKISKANCTSTNRRYYTYDQYLQWWCKRQRIIAGRTQIRYCFNSL